MLHVTEDDAVMRQRFLKLLDVAKIVPWEANARTWVFTYVGRQAVPLLGYPLERWYEDGFWTSHIHPDDREDIVESCLALSQKGDDYDFDYRMIAADGRTVWLRDFVTVEMAEGVPLALRGFLLDITDRKEAEADRRASEERFRIAIELATDIIAEGDVDTGEVIWFGDVDGVLGYELGEFPRTVEGWVASLHPDDRDGVMERFERDIVRGRRGTSLEYRIRRKDGTYRHWVAGVAPRLVDSHQKPSRFIGVISDVTDRVNADIELTQQREALAHAVRVASLGELAASLAHELSQPLAAILSNAQAAKNYLDRESPDIDEVREIVEDIIADDRRAGGVLRRLHGMMKKQAPSRSRVDLGELVTGVVGLMRSALVASGVTIGIQSDAAVPPVDGDENEIQQVLINLIGNAIDAMADLDSGRRNIRMTIAVEPSGAVTVSVRDSGPGIADDALPQVFDSFFSSKPQGLGMGLAICRKIIEAHSGRIWAVNNPDGGATLAFSLPCASEPA